MSSALRSGRCGGEAFEADIATGFGRQQWKWLPLKRGEDRRSGCRRTIRYAPCAG
jgi:hypothetical protein